ncbi:MAG: hypothetical protein KAJ28_10375 [Flavobacteriaceae bacterium]|nr:hypothetical protein [Flavobacteriaceae bacterium]
MKQLSILLVLLIFFTSCIPLRIAPNIKDYKIKVAKKFKRKLPNNYAFIFEDPKEADDFYHFINLKYELNHNNVERNVPFAVNNKKYFLSFYETTIPTKTLDFFPVLFEATIAMTLGGQDSYGGEVEITRTNSWYLVLTVCDPNLEDCLEPNNKYRAEVLSYLRDLKLEYLSSYNNVVHY